MVMVSMGVTEAEMGYGYGLRYCFYLLCWGGLRWTVDRGQFTFLRFCMRVLRRSTGIQEILVFIFFIDFVSLIIIFNYKDTIFATTYNGLVKKESPPFHALSPLKSFCSWLQLDHDSRFVHYHYHYLRQQPPRHAATNHSARRYHK